MEQISAIFKINYKSDFSILEIPKYAGSDFFFQYFCGDKTYECRSSNETYTNCSITEEGDIKISFTSHNLQPGHIYVNRHWYVANTDGTKKEVVSNEWLPVYLTTGTTENDAIDLRGYDFHSLVNREISELWEKVKNGETNDIAFEKNYRNLGIFASESDLLKKLDSLAEDFVAFYGYSNPTGISGFLIQNTDNKSARQIRIESTNILMRTGTCSSLAGGVTVTWNDWEQLPQGITDVLDYDNSNYALSSRGGYLLNERTLGILDLNSYLNNGNYYETLKLAYQAATNYELLQSYRYSIITLRAMANAGAVKTATIIQSRFSESTVYQTLFEGSEMYIRTLTIDNVKQTVSANNFINITAYELELNVDCSNINLGCYLELFLGNVISKKLLPLAGNMNIGLMSIDDYNWIHKKGTATGAALLQSNGYLKENVVETYSQLSTITSPWIGMTVRVEVDEHYGNIQNSVYVYSEDNTWKLRDGVVNLNMSGSQSQMSSYFENLLGTYTFAGDATIRRAYYTCFTSTAEMIQTVRSASDECTQWLFLSGKMYSRTIKLDTSTKTTTVPSWTSKL